MPKIILEFSDDEQSAAREAMEASGMAAALREIDEQCRMWIKHGATSEQERKRLEAIRYLVPEFVRDC